MVCLVMRQRWLPAAASFDQKEFQAMSTFKIPSEWIPSAAVIDDLRGGLAEMDSALARMRSVEPLGEDDFDEAWEELAEAYAAEIDRIRSPLEAEDWPTLAAVIIESREAREAERVALGR
jgi:hypothetical protein